MSSERRGRYDLFLPCHLTIVSVIFIHVILMLINGHDMRLRSDSRYHAIAVFGLVVHGALMVIEW